MQKIFTASIEAEVFSAIFAFHWAEATI